jgi:quercetin dioxygenase-like cupin family protein
MIALWADAAAVEMLPGLVRRTLAIGDRAMLVEFRANAGVVIGIHQHPAEQDGYVVSGSMAITIGGTETSVGSGDSYSIPAGCPHGARFLADTLLMETFSPPREDYRDASKI